MILISYRLHSDIPQILDRDIYFTKSDSGYDLHIRKKEGIESILLTESQKDPMMKKHNYALRTEVFHPANGNEKRILDGKSLQTKYDAFYLVDSTTEKHPILGESFYFFLPEKVLYGYKWAREGIVRVSPGTKINLRLFKKPFADYEGSFKDQWITLRLTETFSIYRPGLFDDLTDIISGPGGGEVIVVTEKSFEKFLSVEIPERIPASESLDVVFIIDTTLSMRDELPAFRIKFKEIRADILKKTFNPRIGMILYKDYGDSYVNKNLELTNDTAKQDEYLKHLFVSGGGDIPEAVNEAIYELNNIGFQAEARIVFLIGDAPAHPSPRGTVTRDDAQATIKKLNIKFYAAGVPY